MSLLSLEQFRRQLHYNPFHFWGWQNSVVPVKSQCNTVVKQYAWQNADAMGRNEVNQAIAEAEKRLAFYLNYSVAPRFTEDTLVYPPFYDRRFWPIQPIDATGHWKPVALHEGYLSAVGVEKLTLLGTVNFAGTFPCCVGPAPRPPYLIYLDTDSDGLVDTFEVSIATTVTDPTQIALYFAAGDRFDYAPLSEDWRIQPISTQISGGFVTIRGRSWMLAHPILYEGVTAPDLDPSVQTNYVDKLDVVQRTCDPTGQTLDTAQGKFIWETLPFPSWYGIWLPTTTTDGSTDPAAQAFALARVGIRDARLGIVFPGEAVFDPTTGFWNEQIPPWSPLFRPPEKVVVRYLAGYPLDKTGQMAYDFQVLVARMAMAELNNRIAACDESNRELYRWQRDRSQVADKTEQYGITKGDLENPLGTRLGHIFAWKEVRTHRLIRGVTNP